MMGEGGVPPATGAAEANSARAVSSRGIRIIRFILLLNYIIAVHINGFPLGFADGAYFEPRRFHGDIDFVLYSFHQDASGTAKLLCRHDSCHRIAVYHDGEGDVARQSGRYHQAVRRIGGGGCELCGEAADFRHMKAGEGVEDVAHASADVLHGKVKHIEHGYGDYTVAVEVYRGHFACTCVGRMGLEVEHDAGIDTREVQCDARHFVVCLEVDIMKVFSGAVSLATQQDGVHSSRTIGVVCRQFGRGIAQQDLFLGLPEGCAVGEQQVGERTVTVRGIFFEEHADTAAGGQFFTGGVGAGFYAQTTVAGSGARYAQRYPVVVRLAGKPGHSVAGTGGQDKQQGHSRMVNMLTKVLHHGFFFSLPLIEW
nr:MAG TPA: hypothetical protein [Caudoviricetes sp.]